MGSAASWAATGRAVGVVCADGGTHVIVAGEAGLQLRQGPPAGNRAPAALSADGRWLTTLVRVEYDDHRGVAHDLVTGLERRFAQDDPAPVLAAPSPDGTRVAWLSVDDDCRIAVGRFEGPSETVWRGRGGTSAESCLSWSPDGRYLACTYLDLVRYPVEHKEWGVVVVDAATGEVVFTARRLITLPGGGSAWRGDAELVVVDQDWHLAVLDLHRRVTKQLEPVRAGIPVGVAGVRLVGLTSAGEDGWRLVTTRLDGDDEQHLLDLPAVGPLAPEVGLVPGLDGATLAARGDR